jgi:hypothetical protein
MADSSTIALAAVVSGAAVAVAGHVTQIWVSTSGQRHESRQSLAQQTFDDRVGMLLALAELGSQLDELVSHEGTITADGVAMARDGIGRLNTDLRGPVALFAGERLASIADEVRRQFDRIDLEDPTSWLELYEARVEKGAATELRDFDVASKARDRERRALHGVGIIDRADEQAVRSVVRGLRTAAREELRSPQLGPRARQSVLLHPIHYVKRRVSHWQFRRNLRRPARLPDPHG